MVAAAVSETIYIVSVCLTIMKLLLFCMRKGLTHSHPPFVSESTQISNEGKAFPVRLEIARMSKLVQQQTLENIYESDAEFEINLAFCNAGIIEKVFEFCRHYCDVEQMNNIENTFKSMSEMEQTVQAWYVDFTNVGLPYLFALMNAAEYLDIKPLYDLTVAKAAIAILDKTLEEIRGAHFEAYQISM